MPIIKVGNVFNYKFRGTEEPRIEVLLGGLPTFFSTIRPKRELSRDDKYILALGMDQEQYDEVYAAMLDALQQLNEAAGFKATKKQLEDALKRAVGPSTSHEGQFRFFGSKKMAYADRDSGELVAASLPVFDADGNEISGKDAVLGHGSVVRSAFVLSLWRKDKSICLNINPSKVIVVTKVDPPKKESMSHDGLDDAPNAYDY